MLPANASCLCQSHTVAIQQPTQRYSLPPHLSGHAGGHLNPAVTFSTLICGFYPVIHSILYIALQVGAQD